MVVPSRRECFELLWSHNVPQNIIRHSIAVSRIAADVAQGLLLRRKRINLELLDRACLLHDIGKLKAIQTGGNHEEIGYEILAKHGYGEVAEIIRKHPVHYIYDAVNRPSSWEEKVLYYADKRANGHKVVSLRERFADFRKRYQNFRESIDRAEPLAARLEKELLSP
ncbi:HDIG domain-containing protein [Candidatus Woesearchaeota archaeon]|nr:HDIG domain-containing protein [Candidatus Woesearchaeota archaeon]